MENEFFIFYEVNIMYINVYDFDKTIYDGDSTLDFYLYTIKKNPLLLRYFPKQVFGFIMYTVGVYEKKKFKEYFFSFLNGVTNIDKIVSEFWEGNSYKIKEWYLNQQDENDLIISASPTFLLKHVCNKVGIKHLLATDVHIKTGKFETENCYGEEKVKRMQEIYPDIIIDKFYSDSISDQPLANLAKISYLVDGNNIRPWKCEK